MWQRFTERARRVILLGQEEAGKLDSGHVGTEHLLLGLARENDGSGAHVLEKMGVSLDQVRVATLAALPTLVGSSASAGEPKLMPKAKRVLELAADEARRLRHNYIGTEHLLLALLREKDGIAWSVLRALGIELENARAQVTAYLEEKHAPEAATPTAATSGESGDVAAIGAAVVAAPVAAQFSVAPAVRVLLDFAAQESREVGASHVEIVHLLRALCREESESARLLESAGVDVDNVRALLRGRE